MFLFCSYLKSLLFASLSTYAISKVIITLTYLAFYSQNVLENVCDGVLFSWLQVLFWNIIYINTF